MNIDSVLAAVREGVDATLRGTMMTLGEFIAELEALDQDLEISFLYPEGTAERLDDEWHQYTGVFGLGDLRSYRGYYQYLAFGPSKVIGTVGEALEKAKSAIGEVFEGYKGGDYEMTAETLLWCSYYGESSELKVISVVATDSAVEGKKLVHVLTAFEEDEDYDYEAMSKSAESKYYESVGRRLLGAEEK